MSIICRSTRRTPLRRLAWLPAVLVLACGFVPAGAGAVPGEVKLGSVFAAPISGAEPRCTPEPGGRLIYGTQVPFDPARPISSPTGAGTAYPGAPGYVPANMPSTATIVPARQAGASSDLCVGFTLTPNMEPGFVRSAANTLGRRLQEDPPVPDVEATRVLDGGDGDDIKDIAIDLPAGFAGAPDGVGACSTADFGVGNYLPPSCGPTSQVGTAYVRISTLLNGGLRQHLALGGLPNQSGGYDGGQVFNLAHGPNDLALLGVSIAPVPGIAPAKFTVRLTFTPDGSGRIRGVTQNAPRHLYLEDFVDLDTGQIAPGTAPFPLYVESIGIRAWGAKADHPTLPADFAQFGTSCTEPLQADVDVATYGGTRSQGASPGLTLTGCDQLPFAPSVSVTTAERRAGVPTAATVRVELPQSSQGPRSALLRNAEVTLPAGLELGAQSATREGGLELCSASEFAAGTQNPAACPAASRAGEVKITTPLLAAPLTGQVFLGEQAEVGALPALYLEATPEGATAADAPRIKLAGRVAADEQGTVTTTFDGVPQLRFSALELTFPGGPSALFRTPRTCGTTTGVSRLTSWASATPKEVTSTLTIDQDCELPAFAPQFSMNVANPAAGASSTTTVQLRREDRSPWLKDVRVALPAGFLANLSAATECGGTEASRGECPEGARIATVRTVAGAGERPLTLEGAMYLRDRDPGAVAAAQILVRARIGEIDLGTVNVPARIDLRPTDAGLVLTTQVPLRFRGLALDLREITVQLDRQGFPLNPTACGPLAATADFTGEAGQSASRTTAVAFTGCQAKPFQPGFSASLTGDLAPGGHPRVAVTMTPRPGDANLSAATVTLPAGVATDLNNLQAPCSAAAFETASCPASARVGSATARVSITPEVITGDVFLVSVAGLRLPGIGMSFTGRYAQRVLSTVRVDGERIVTDFASIPDLPLTRLDLVIDGGAKSPIQLSKRACTASGTWNGTLRGHGGQTAAVTDRFPCEAALIAPIKPTMSRTKGLGLTVDAEDGERIRYIKVTLSSPFRLQRSAALRKHVASKAASTRLSERRRSSKSFFVSSTARSGRGPGRISVQAGLRALRLPAKYQARGIPKGTRIKVRVRAVLESGRATVRTGTARAR